VMLAACFWLLVLILWGLTPQFHLQEIEIILGYYSITLFVALSEILLSGGAAWLTQYRGENWTKEIDYFYLALAGVGLAMSVGRMSVEGKDLSLSATIGAAVVATALVLRVIKTRAEIGGWNRKIPNKK
jgi:hypothetical protein